MYGMNNIKFTVQKFLLYFEGYLELFAVFNNFYVPIPLFLVEPATMFCGTVVGKRCYIVLKYRMLS
jgi:hypothetical protein